MNRRRFIALWLAAVVATAMAFVVHLAMRFENVHLGYEVDAEKRDQRRLLEQQRNLAIEAATLRNASRIEAVARTALDMDVPDPSRIVPLGRDGSATSARTAGRVR